MAQEKLNMEAEKTGGVKWGITVCKGGSNVHMISYYTGKELEKEGYGKFIPIATKEEHRERMLADIKEVDRLLLIDGCRDACGMKALEAAGIKPDVYLVVADEGIEKRNDMNFSKDEIRQIKEKVVSLITSG